MALRRDGPADPRLNPGTGVEILVPGLLRQRRSCSGRSSTPRPQVFAHNLETVPRIFKRIRPAFRYERSLDVLTQGRAAGMVTKSNLILGLGETREEVSQALRDLHDAGCDLVTITQYLRPSPLHHPVERWVRPEEFVELREEAEADRLRRRHERAAGAVVVPGRAAVGAGDGRRGEQLPEALAHLASAGPGPPGGGAA